MRTKTILAASLGVEGGKLQEMATARGCPIETERASSGTWYRVAPTRDWLNEHGIKRSRRKAKGRWKNPDIEMPEGRVGTRVELAEAIAVRSTSVVAELEGLGMPVEQCSESGGFLVAPCLEWGEANPDIWGRFAGEKSDEARISAASVREKEAKADLAEIKAKEARGELMRVSDFEERTLAMIAVVRSALLALPTRVAGRCGPDAEEAVREEVYKTLEALSDS